MGMKPVVRKRKNINLTEDAIEMLKRLASRHGTSDSGYLERRIRDDAKAEGVDLKDLENKS